MAISGNISSTTYDLKKAGLPANQINIQPLKLNTDDKVWPCGLLLHKGASGWEPYDSADTGLIAVLDQETDTSITSVANGVRFGAVKKHELKIGVDTPAQADATALNKLEERHIYAV